MVIANGPPISSRTAGMMAVRTAGTEAGGSRAGRTVRGAGKGDDKPAASPAVGRRQPPGLESFVVGPSNRMAFAAVELAASRPGEMSPLVLHGPSGVGKTHLLEGICGLARRENPGQSTLFLSAEQFTTSFLQALHGSGLPGFRRTCRGVDLLVIDDLQFFVGKRATLMELQHTVDALHRQGKQMVFAADREIEALAELGPDLVTRLRGGMNARILPPDYDVRRGIVAAIASRRGLALPEEVVHYIASHMTRHARELAGAVNRLEATSHMLGLPITLEMAGEALSDLVRSSARSVRLADIERAVCSAFGIDSGSLKSARRGKTVNHPRMLAMFLARKHTASALAEIGSYFGRRSHSTVISAQKTVQDWVSSGSQILLAEATWDVEEAIRRVEDVLRAG
jgi:chromosomal replication initiator protein